MTNDEFTAWTKRFFTAFPSVFAWLKNSSPDYRATLALWRESLRNYSADECGKVLDDWNAMSASPFAAYDKDKIPQIVRSVIDKKRNRARSAMETAEARRRFEAARSGEVAKMPFEAIAKDPGMLRGFVELSKAANDLQNGSITEADYETAKKRVLDEMESVE